MPSLKALKNRIASVKSTRKITKAMQMVAAAKLRRAQEAAEAARPYAERMSAVISGLSAGQAGSASAPRLLAGTGTDKTHLLVVLTSERGLCGGFNSTIVRLARARAQELIGQGRTVKILTVGKKGYEKAWDELGAMAGRGQAVKDQLSRAVDEDTDEAAVGALAHHVHVAAKKFRRAV